MKLAILADIHGNLPALDAVARELERLQPDYVVVNGDLINGVPFSAEVIDRIRGLGWAVVRGNHEFYLLDLGTSRAAPGSDDAERWGQLHWLCARVTPAQAAYLAMLPDERTLYLPGAQPLRVTHGLPGRNKVGLYRSQPDDKIAVELTEVREATFVTAHTHVQIDRHIHWLPEVNGELSTHPHGDMHQPGGAARDWHVINPGSVGLPLDQRATAQFAMLEAVDDATARGGLACAALRSRLRPAACTGSILDFWNAGCGRRHLHTLLLGACNRRTGDSLLLPLGLRAGTRPRPRGLSGCLPPLHT
jgi:predicted phosphodiesterase